MRNHIIIAGVALSALLAGCTDAATSKREAGNWTNEVELLKFDVPGMPPEMKQGMEQMMASATNSNYCLSAEEAEKNDLNSLLNGSGGNAGECTWSKQDIKGANVDIAGTCNQGGQMAELAMKGTMESTRSDITISTKAKMPDGKDMEMVMRVRSKHTGACVAPEAPVAPVAPAAPAAG